MCHDTVDVATGTTLSNGVMLEASLRAAEPGGSGTKRSGADHRSPSRSPSSEASLRAAKPGGSGTEQRGADHRSPSRSPSPETSLRAAEPGGSGTERRGANHRSPSRLGAPAPRPPFTLPSKPGGSEPNRAAPTTGPPAG
ncbi:hypothetical protein Agub_g15803 [Astrephomene gubernaculifera]|uniref:Uncharacterized protein n=1 Tax=Astrephomene gubernaculifera TaxID=47775 RepID=A0AAD3E448_9CHLO|nr:hypothetical protein Agub_g15803 [Astrephomene gubernaculifera]